ncbi:acyl carrier protein [Streptosporangium sp. CA-115845]|uniref:acyl carrier protein n=1 Tax=Streptosporangium sp. CA-115845 TaxID=3240071 RepID=UPI003D930D3C
MSHTYDTAHDLRALVRDLWLSLLPDGHSGTFTDGGGDSLSALRLIGAVYGACGVRMTWDDLSTATDVGDFAARVLDAVSTSGEDRR